MNNENESKSPKEERPIKPNPDVETSHTEAVDDGLPKVGRFSLDYKKKIGIGVFVVILAFILFGTGHHTETKTDEKKPVKNEHNIPDYTPKKIETPVKQGTLVKEPPKPTADELAMQKMQMVLEMKRQEMAMKLAAKKAAMYELRLKSPMDLIKDDNTITVSQPASSGHSTVANEPPGPQSRLPLTAAQIDALSQAEGNDPNEAFQKRAESNQVAQATAVKIPFYSETITQGTIIPANLETAINSDLPGQIKAVVSDDVYSADGSHKLLFKGDELVGVYNSGVLLGQRRVMAMWTQVTRHDGVRVLLGSPGTDSLGMSGFDADVLQTHFWERFGGATLVSIVGGLVATAGVDQEAGYNSASDYRMMMSQNFQQTANSQLLAGMNRKPTIVKYQGAKINVFVNRDLSFHGVEGVTP